MYNSIIMHYVLLFLKASHHLLIFYEYPRPNISFNVVTILHSFSGTLCQKCDVMPLWRRRILKKLFLLLSWCDGIYMVLGVVNPIILHGMKRC